MKKTRKEEKLQKNYRRVQLNMMGTNAEGHNNITKSGN